MAWLVVNSRRGNRQDWRKGVGKEQEGVPSGHEVSLVDNLEERANTGLLPGLATSGVLANGSGSLANTSDDDMGVGASLGGLIDGLDDDGLVSGVAAAGDDNDLSRLQELNHSAVYNINST